ncbi:MAG: ribonuclease P protein component [Cocleimonas sp.]
MNKSGSNTLSKLSFDNSLRLLLAADYQFVFNKAERFGNTSFTVLARKNNLDHARLGLAISKKCAKKAVDRNRIKRLFRESFRLNQYNLPNIDIIAMCKPNAIMLSNKEMHAQIETQWYFMRKKFQVKSPTSD